MNTERHNFDLGDIVIVFCQTYGGQFVVEGTASIMRILPNEDTYRVRFLEDSRKTYIRYVDPNGQENPGQYLNQLNGV